ncbi:YSC84-related protein [Ascidiimonas aurantiaca]|uniref:lipid-binding SYLF domain-containing protein n=1 Tax=Ascidiimonas aurantiaca TaxID=1685432 RepID=UPI0030EBA185
MKVFKILILCLTITMGSKVSAQEKNTNKLMEDVKSAKEMLIERDAGLQKFFDESAGYVIFPNVGKGGFIVGGASGNGILYENGKAQGIADLKKISVGLQAGGQAIIEVIFFENDDELNKFKNGEFQFAASASAVAVKSGVAVNAKYKDGVAVFALPKAGLMADASVGGQKFSYKPFNKDSEK